LDPGFTNTNMNVVFCDVDMEDEQNKKPELEEGEIIETFKARPQIYMKNWRNWKKGMLRSSRKFCAGSSCY
jgi:hypothetical protein